LRHETAHLFDGLLQGVRSGQGRLVNQIHHFPQRNPGVLGGRRRGIELLPLAADPIYGISHVIDMAHIYTLLGERDEALDQIEELLSRPGWVSVPWLEMDPRFTPLRDHPRYRALCEKYRVAD